MSKKLQQVGGGACSLCGTPGTTKTNCPLNPAAKNPNQAKHTGAGAAAAPAAAKPKSSPKAKAAAASIVIPAHVENFMNIIENEQAHTKLKAILDKMPAATKKACKTYVNRILLTRESVKEINDITSYEEKGPGDRRYRASIQLGDDYYNSADGQQWFENKRLEVYSKFRELSYSQQGFVDKLESDITNGIDRIAASRNKDAIQRRLEIDQRTKDIHKAMDRAIDMNDHQRSLPYELSRLLSTILDLQKMKTPESQALLKTLMTFLNEYASYLVLLILHWRKRHVVYPFQRSY